MLAKTRKNSPIRLAAGLAGVSALSLAALGLTASGTQAAEKIRDKVETRLGIDLEQAQPAPPAPPAAAELPAPAAAPAAQAAPAPQAAPAAPEAPKVQRHVYRFNDGEAGKDGKQVRKIVMVQADGQTREIEMPDPDAIRASIPEIRDGNCGKDGKAHVEQRTEGDKKIMIICSDRIEMASVDAERMARVHKRLGMESAMMGLRQARRAIETESHMTADERAKALRGIDKAIRELEETKSKD